jgi:hypothetical protein
LEKNIWLVEQEIEEKIREKGIGHQETICPQKVVL